MLKLEREFGKKTNTAAKVCNQANICRAGTVSISSGGPALAGHAAAPRREEGRGVEADEEDRDLWPSSGVG